MESVSILLSPEYGKFASEIQSIREEYKEAQEKHALVLKELKKRVLSAQEEFENWKASQTNASQEKSDE